MLRGWAVEYADGTIIKENQMEWKKIPKINMKCLTLHYDGRQWSLADKLAYVQKKRASMVPGVPESFQVESRSIGYYEEDKKVWYTVDEATGKMTMEVTNINVN